MSSACVLSLCPTINERRREARAGPVYFPFVLPARRVFLAISGPLIYFCVPLWVVLALVWAVSSACVLSLRPAGLSGSLWPLFELRPQPVSRACFLRAFLCRSGPCSGCILILCPQLAWWRFWGVRAVSSACVLSLFPAGLSVWLWPLFVLCPHPASSACLVAFLGRSGPYLACLRAARR